MSKHPLGLHGLDSWIEIDKSEIKFPLQEFEDKIDALVVMQIMTGFKYCFTKLATANDVRFAIDFANDDMRLNIMIIEVDNQFKSIVFSFFCEFGTPLYKFIVSNHKTMGYAHTNEEIRSLLNTIGLILIDVDKYNKCLQVV